MPNFRMKRGTAQVAEWMESSRFNSLGTANTLFEGTGDLTCANKIKNYAAKRIGEAQLSRNALHDSEG